MGRMKRRKRRQEAPHPVERRPATSFDRRIILLDDAPWRQRTAADCKRELAKLDKARAEWQRFQQKDQPAFARWTAATFGPLLTALRDNENLLDEQEAFIEEVELEMICGNHRNYRKAYATVKREWDNPDHSDNSAAEESPAPEDNAFKPGADSGDGLPDSARQALFEEFVQCMGTDLAGLSKAEREEMFAQFEIALAEEELRQRPAGPRAEKKPATATPEARLKEIYRILVRRLHPDLLAAKGAAVASIWHEVQEAYQARNLERLETLLALTQMQDGTEAGQASLLADAGSTGRTQAGSAQPAAKHQ